MLRPRGQSHHFFSPAVHSTSRRLLGDQCRFVYEQVTPACIDVTCGQHVTRQGQEDPVVAEFRGTQSVIEAGKFPVQAAAGQHLETLARSGFDECRDQQPIDEFFLAAAFTYQPAQGA